MSFIYVSYLLSVPPTCPRQIKSGGHVPLCAPWCRRLWYCMVDNIVTQMYGDDSARSIFNWYRPVITIWTDNRLLLPSDCEWAAAAAAAAAVRRRYFTSSVVGRAVVGRFVHLQFSIGWNQGCSPKKEVGDAWKKTYYYNYYNHLTASFPGQPG